MEYRVSPPKPTSRDLVLAVLVVVPVNELVADVELAEAARLIYLDDKLYESDQDDL